MHLHKKICHGKVYTFQMRLFNVYKCKLQYDIDTGAENTLKRFYFNNNGYLISKIQTETRSEYIFIKDAVNAAPQHTFLDLFG